MLVVATCPSNLKKCGAKRSRKPTQIHMIPTAALSRLERLNQRAVFLFTVLWLAVKLLPLHASFNTRFHSRSTACRPRAMLDCLNITLQVLSCISGRIIVFARKRESPTVSAVCFTAHYYRTASGSDRIRDSTWQESLQAGSVLGSGRYCSRFGSGSSHDRMRDSRILSVVKFSSL